MAKILGIDTGTNSLGWAVVERNENNECTLLEYGVNIFQEGVKIEKGIESSRAAERTAQRSQRKLYWRRKLRKIRLLTVLSENHLCPPLAKGSLRIWRTKGIYPESELFMQWQRTEDKEGINPYYYRHLCLTQRLDLSDITNRYIVGRALYHINQRRGFLSNRKEDTAESDGKVKTGISDLSEEMAQAGCEFLGEFFYQLYQKGEKIRTHYTSRNDHYLAEFHAICEKQGLDPALVEKLEKAIFFQRPLKSQKQSVGKCVFETRKSRCPASHPLFEEYRMYAFINNIKINTSSDSGDEMRPLTDEEKEAIKPLFFRRSRTNFPFEDIAKKLAGKGKYCHVKDKESKPCKFNYYMDTSVSGCPVTASLMDIFGDDWQDCICEVYTLAKNKSRREIVNDVWHALFFYSDEQKLKEFAANRLQLDEEQADKFSKIKLPGDYASLSLKAIRNILPYMKKWGLIYSEAVFLGKLHTIVPACDWKIEGMREAAIEKVIGVLHEEVSPTDVRTKERRVKDYLAERYGASEKQLAALYHPSMLEAYPRQRSNDNGIFQLGSPRLNSVRNPMAMHSLFRLRKVVNALLKKGSIDENTVVQVEFSRDLNDANRRKAIHDWQRANEKKRDTYRENIKELFAEEGIKGEPTEDDILKYELWEEQGHKCLYTSKETGKEIALTDFLGPNPKYDIEHTVPQSAGGDSTKMNLTLCQNAFNRDVKKNQLPSQLANYESILESVKPWKEKCEELDKQIRRTKQVHPTTKEAKDANIQRRHRLLLERDYWRGKYSRFTMTEVPEGFARRQGTDNSVISRYARLYLKSVFHKVYIVKGIETSDFRKLWGIQEEFTKKERVNHVHHCIDAVTIACIGQYEVGQLAHFYHQLEDSKAGKANKPQFPKPWSTFAEDMKRLGEELLVAHYTQDNMMKTGRRRIQTPQGKMLAKGDAARGSLHLDTCYGAIEQDGQIKCVVRQSLDMLGDSNIKNIVDPVVRAKVEEAARRNGNLKKAVEADDVWMNKEKGIRIKKVRCLTANKLENLLHIRKQRDLSRHEYKQSVHVANDSNYMLAVYEGTNAKGKTVREFEEINNLEAARYYRASNKAHSSVYGIVPEKSKSGYPLLYKLMKGTMVLMYENSPEEVWDLGKKGLQARLYKITGISVTDGRMVLTHQQEARPTTEVGFKDGAYQIADEFRPRMRVRMTQFKALVEGVDFELNDLGEIVRLI